MIAHCLFYEGAIWESSQTGERHEIMNIVITDPVNNDIDREEGNFEELWAALGREVQEALKEGPIETSWCNIGVTHEADTVSKCIMHRTVAITEE